jgi:hypothetical protein
MEEARNANLSAWFTNAYPLTLGIGGNPRLARILLLFFA